jgi:uncharacterized protein YciI
VKKVTRTVARHRLGVDLEDLRAKLARTESNGFADHASDTVGAHNEAAGIASARCADDGVVMERLDALDLGSLHHAHASWKQFHADGHLLMVGPFTDAPAGGAMGIFTNRDAAERFVKADPFVSDGIVARWTLREWNEVLAT